MTNPIEVNVHPLAEIIVKKLSGISRVPYLEQMCMINRAVKAAVKYHDEKLATIQVENGWLKRERERSFALLRNVMDFSINRYLMANHRLDGAEKSDRHIYLCKVIISYYFAINLESVSVIDDEFDLVHQATKPLTDNLDLEIGFPLDGTRPDYERLVPLFFDKFTKLALSALEEQEN